MGEIVKQYEVRSGAGERPRRMRFLFDTGTHYSFARLSAVRGMAGLRPLATPREFGALGDGAFVATHGLDLEVKLLGIWCLIHVYVVPDGALDLDYDVLVGGQFMQDFNFKLDLRRRDARPNRVSVRLSQKVRGRIGPR